MVAAAPLLLTLDAFNQQTAHLARPVLIIDMD